MQEPTETNSLLERDTRSKTQRFRDSFGYLKQSPRDLLLAYTSKFCTLAAFRLMTVGMPIYLSEVHEISDIVLGVYFAIVGIASFLYAFLVGGFADKYGIRLSLIISGGLGIVVFAGLTAFTNVVVQILAIMICLIPSVSMSLPACKLAIKLYTVPEARSLAFSIMFALLLASGALAAGAVDLALSIGDEDFTTYRYIFLAALGLQCIGFAVAWFVRNLDFEHFGETEIEPNSKVNLVTHTTGLLAIKGFWRFLGVVAMMVISRTVYLQADITLPLFMYRDIEEGAHFGVMIAIHQVFTVLITPLLTWMVYCFSNYTLLIIGGVMSALAPLAFLLGSSYFTVSLFLVGVSIGEAIHGPRLTEYTLQVCPPGKEAGFLAITATPLAASFVLGGILAGPLLESFCPEDGERSCWAMWLVFSLVATISPLVLFFCRPCLDQSQIMPSEGPDETREEVLKSDQQEIADEDKIA